MDQTASFGYWLRRRRKALDLTQADLAREVGCALGTIRKIESDERRPSRPMALRIAQILAMPAAEQAAFLDAARGERATDQLATRDQPLMPVHLSHQRLDQLSLPLTRTSLIGRAREVADVCTLLERAATHLVTLIGPPGIGKTRLSFEIMSELRASFPDGIYFCALAPISDPNLVIPKIAQTLDITEQGNLPLLMSLAQRIGEQHILIVLDNCEQITGAAPLISDLLTACPNLKLLATSRVPLRLYGEYEYAVPPLALPDTRGDGAPESIAQAEAVRLFMERAQAVRFDFTLTAANAAAIAEICTRLDGVPLAIELAATRVKLLSPQALLARLHQKLDLLTHGAHDVPGRHRTLRHAIAWSYDLLDVREQRLFRQLSVFVGGWTIEAAEAVCGDALDSSFEVFDGLASLLNKSLLRQQIGVDDEARFGMLELIREYARERLMASDESGTIRGRHAAYFLTHAETAAPLIHGPDQVAWLDRLEQEHDNFRAALQWSQTEAGDHELSLRLAVALARFWLAHSHLSEGRRWLEAALAAYPAVETPLRAKALFEAGALADVQGDHDRQRVLQGESLRIYEALGDKAGMAAALNCLGNAENGDEARRLHEQSLALYREIGDLRGTAKVLNNLGADVFYLGEHDLGRSMLEESLELSKAAGNIDGTIAPLLHLAWFAVEQDDHAQALNLCREATTLSYQTRDRLGLSWGLRGLLVANRGVQHAEWIARLRGIIAALETALGVNVTAEDESKEAEVAALAKAHIGEDRFAACWAEGNAMSLDDAVAYALAELSPSK